MILCLSCKSVVVQKCFGAEVVWYKSGLVQRPLWCKNLLCGKDIAEIVMRRLVMICLGARSPWCKKLLGANAAWWKSSLVNNRLLAKTNWRQSLFAANGPSAIHAHFRFSFVSHRHWFFGSVVFHSHALVFRGQSFYIGAMLLLFTRSRRLFFEAWFLFRRCARCSF